MSEYDVALLRLPIHVAVRTPVLADNGFHIHVDLKVHGLKLLNDLEIMQMDVKPNGICYSKGCFYNGTYL